ncbi:MAG: FtsX-like permease family protein [Pseudomonadota bacterium]
MKFLLRASWQFFSRQPAQLMLALIGVAAGVAVVTGVALMRTAMIDSLDSAARALAGDDSLRIESRLTRDLDQDQFARLSQLPGSPVLIPFLSQRVRSDGATLELLATDPISASAGQVLAANRGPATGLLGSPRGVIINQATADRLGLQLDSELSVSIDGRDATLDILAIFDNELWLDNRLLMDLGGAQTLLGKMGRLSWISAPSISRTWLSEHLGPELELVKPAQRRASVERLTAGLRINLTALSLLALVVGLFVVHAVLSFLLVQRQQQIGMLRALGVTLRRLRTWLLTEVLLLTGFGALIGLAAGTELARGLLVLIQSPAAELYGVVTGQQIMPSRSLYGGILALTLLLAAISVSGLIITALSIPPGQLSRGARQEISASQRALLAALLFSIGLVLILGSSSLIAALLALFFWLSACAVIVPLIALALLAAIRRFSPSSLFGRALGMLAASRQRLSPSLAALSLALGLSAGMALMVDGFRTAVDDWVTRLLRADVYLSLQAEDFSPTQFQTMQQDWPEVAAVSSVRQIRQDDGSQLVAYELPEAARGGFEFLAGGEAADWAAFDRGQGVLISEPQAQRRALALGDSVSWTTPSGEISRPIVGIYRDYANDNGQIAMADRFYRTLFDDTGRDSVGLYLKAGQSLPDSEQLLLRLGLTDEQLNRTRREDVRLITLAIFDRTFRITQALALLVGLIAVISLISALMALGLERRREYATLRALGLSRGGLRRWILTQTVGLALVAAVLAIPISLLIHLVLSLAVQPRAFGWSVPLDLSIGPWLQLVPLAVAAGLLAGLIPAWSIGRRAVSHQLRSR